MTWATNVPRGDLLPLNERPRFKGNWDYIEAEMRDNHYWDEDSNKDGRHKRCDMPNLESNGDITVDANGDPDVIPTSTNGIYYVRAKTATEAPNGQFSEPHYAMNDGTNLQFMQLGFRALAVFDGRTDDGDATIQYSHNVSTVSRGTSNGQSGVYTVNFSVDLPSEHYIVLCGGIRNTTNADRVLSSSVQSTDTLSDVKTASLVRLIFSRNTASSIQDPLSGWVAIIGG